MAQLPDVNTMGRRPSITDRGGIASRQTGFQARAVQGVGDQVANIGEQVIQRHNRLELAEARSTMIKTDLETRAKLKDDPDYATHEERYQDAMSTARGEAMKGMTSTSDKSIFTQESDIDILNGNSVIKGNARQKEVDVSRASLDTIITDGRANAMEAEDVATKMAIVATTNEAISGAREKGYISAVEETNMKQAWIEDVSLSTVEMMPVGERIEALESPKGTFAENIHKDVRVKMLDRAKTEQREGYVRAEAQFESDKIMAKGGTLKEDLADARKIEDPEVRDSVTSRVKNRHNEMNAIENADKADALATGHDVFSNGGGWEDIPEEVVARMEPAQRNQLKAYMKAGGNVPTDLKVWTELRNLQNSNPMAFAQVDPDEYRAVLSEVDYKNLVNDISATNKAIQKHGATVNAGIGVETEITMVNKWAVQSGAKNEEGLFNFTQRYNYRVNRHLQETGAEPTFIEKEQILNNMAKDIVVDDDFWNTTKTSFDVTLEDIDQKHIDDVRDVLIQEGLSASDQDVLDWIIEMGGVGNAK